MLLLTCQLRDKAEAVQVTTGNLEEVAEWCGGSVRGTKLPAEDRVVQWYSFFNDCQYACGIGGYVVKLKDRDFIPCDDDVFDGRYEILRSQNA